jgi:N-acetylated-alpha-linked acidic dipeptidase
VREAIEQRRWDDARAYVVRTARVIEDYADRLDQAAAMGRPPA